MKYTMIFLLCSITILAGWAAYQTTTIPMLKDLAFALELLGVVELFAAFWIYSKRAGR
ncbi:MAG: hypothetical protein KGJ90_06220 [Patescibacteria group bacterium]|nr:hypothetical protein [Patescibacteria group bacterium]